MEMNRSAKKQPSTPAWNSDRVHECSSAEVLLSWLIADDNYARWTNSSQQQGAVTKNELCDEINGLLQAQRIQHRNRCAIYRKVRFIEKSMEEAWRLLSENGTVGVDALVQCNSRFKKKVLGICPYFKLLARVIRPPMFKQSAKQDQTKTKSYHEWILESWTRRTSLTCSSPVRAFKVTEIAPLMAKNSATMKEKTAMKQS